MLRESVGKLGGGGVVEAEDGEVLGGMTTKEEGEEGEREGDEDLAEAARRSVEPAAARRDQ